VARRGIRAAAEITFNYGYDLDDYREHPCRCGAADCTGYILAEEYFEHVRKHARWREEPRMISPRKRTLGP
jgi:hypothetical protein